MNKHHEISHLIHINPKEASKRILNMLRRNGMHKGNTAKAIGCGHNTLIIWIKQLDLAKAIDKETELAIKEGRHHGRLGGRPRKPESEKSTAKKARAKKSTAKKTRARSRAAA